MVGITTCASAGQPLWETLPPAAALPPLSNQGHVTRDGASIWYGVIGKGAPVLLLHGGMASSDSWGEQVPALVKAGYRVILIDTRGHGRSTLGTQPLSYELFADDVIAVMDALQLRQAISLAGAMAATPLW
jgi:pimeloyl-ACP methyl ester carboxylesterase